MTIDYTEHSSGHSIDLERELSYAEKARKKVEARVEGLMEDIQLACFEVFRGNDNSDYSEQLREKIIVIHKKMAVADDSEEEIKFIKKELFQELDSLTQTEWPLAYCYAKKEEQRIRERVNFAIEEFSDKFNFEDKFAFEEIYNERAGKVVYEARLELKASKDRNRLMAKKLKEIQQVRDDVEFDIAKFSVFDTQDKIFHRIGELNTLFPDLDYDSEEKDVDIIGRKTEILCCGKPFDQKMKIIKEQLDKFQAVDMEIEKKYMVRVIRKRYEELIETVRKLEAEGLSLSDEVCYATHSVEGSKLRIEGIGGELAPTSLSHTSQLEIATKGTLNTLEHTLKDAYIKYGEHTISNAMQLLPFSDKLNVFEGIGEEEKKALEVHRDILIQKAKIELIWGEARAAEKVPPLLPEEKIVEIIDKHLEQASRSIYLAYAEQRIKKYLKFCLLRKSFEGCSEEQKRAVENKADQFIVEAKRELQEYLSQQEPPRISMNEKSAKVLHSPEIDEAKVEAIIGGYIQKLYSVCLRHCKYG